MAKIETPVTELKINKLTKEQYDAIENPSDTELYFVKDEPISYNELVDTPDLKPVATSGSYNDLTNRPVFNGIEMNDTNPMFYGSSTTAATETIKVVSIPSITQLNAGQIIVVQPTITSTVASSSIQLNNFPAYSMRYNNSAVTTSNASYAWNSNFPSVWLFDGTYWVFLAHGIDYNTTYTLSNLMDSGRYTAGSGTYAITRYSLVMQKPDQTWEKITSTNANYSTATTKVVNPNGFILNQIKYYYTTTNYASGALVAANYIYSKYSGIDLRYSTNCGNTPGWVVGQYIYLVGTIHSDGLFYLDPAQWWTTVLPTTNDGKLYIRIGHVTGTYNSSFYEDRPVFFHDGNKLCEYKAADNKQDVLVSGSNIKTVNGNSIVGEGDVHIDSLPNQADNSGKFLTTNGSEASWVDISQVPDQTGFSGKFLTTNGTIASWAELSAVALSGSYNDLSDKPVLTDFTTPAQQAAIDSGITTSLVAKIGTNAANIEGINLKIPREATSSNQLADKAFVDSMVSSLLARYITSNSAGDSFATNAALLAGPYYLDGNLITTSNLNVNDYAMVMEDETHDGKPARYIWSGTQWSFQYVLNNTTFTQAQIDAMNSTITYSKVQDYDAHLGNTTIHVTQANKDTWNAKQDAITGGATTILTTDLAANRALGSNVNGKVVVSDTTFTELGYVHGVTSSIQTQLNSKALDSNTVHKTGNESITGYKTFTDPTTTVYLTVNPLNDSPTSQEGGEIRFVGASGEVNAGKPMFIDRCNGRLRLYGYDSSATVHVQLEADAEHNTLYGVAPTEDTTTSRQIDTVGARNTKLQGYQTKLSEGTGISFEDNKVSIIQLDKTYTEIGSLTQSSEGVYSGFNATSYVRLALGFTDQFANGSGIFKAKTGSSLSGTQTILCDTATTQHLIGLVNGVPSFVDIENSVQLLNTPLSPNTWYWFNIYAEPTNGDITYLCLVDDGYTMEQVATDQTLPWVPYVFVAHDFFLDAFANTSLQVGKDFWGDYWTGEIDLKNSFSQIDGQIVWIYTDLGVVPAKATVDKYGLVRPDDTTISINDGIISYKNTNGYVNEDDVKNIIDEERSNCLTEIPQDINIVSNNDGSFTIKAGSKFCIPMGGSDYKTVVLQSDTTINTVAFTDRYMYFMTPNGGITRSSVSHCFSGTTAPTGFAGNYALWYDTANGLMKFTSDGGTIWTTGYSFPIVVVSSEMNVGFTIERIFNGIGYIGNTIFALPGIKGLIPDGRNEDGTLKSIPFEITKPSNRTFAYPFIDAILMLNENYIDCGTPSECFYQEEEPENPYNKWTNWYNPKTNLLLASPQNTSNWSQSKFCYWCGYATKDTVSFYDLEVNSTYQAPSRDDVEYMIEDASNSEKTCCMIQADQNIKIVLDSSTHKLTLKAGSVIYKPAGMSGNSRVFARYVIPADVVMSSNYSNFASSTHRLFGLDGANGFVNYGATPNAEGNRFVYSGTTAPTEFYDDGAGHLGAWWYDTSTNYIKVTNDGGTTWTTGYSFPICSVTIVNGTGITEIEHVFSNFGFMGSHVFSLPGVKGLAPYGRTEDGKLYNLVISSRCSIYQGFTVEFITNRTGDLNEVFNGSWIERESLDGFPNYNGFWYNIRENRVYRVANGVPTETPCYKVFRGKDVIWKNGVGTINDIELYQPFRGVNQEWVKNYVDYDKTANVVHKTGDEIISGVKTFDSRVRVNNNSSTNEPHLSFTNKNIVKGDTAPAAYRTLSIDFAAGSATTGTSTELGYIRSWYNTSGGVNYSQIDIIAIDPDPNHTHEGGNRKNASMYLYTNGTKQFAQLSFEPIDAVSSTSYSFIPTMGWVNDPARSLNVVHRSGDENISGVKTFNNIVNIKDITYDLFDSTASSRYLYFRDKSSHSTGWVETRINHNGVEGESRLRLFAQTYTDNTFTTTVSSVIDVVAQPDGTKYATAPTPDVSSNDIKIATTSWVRTNLNNSIDNNTISKNASDQLQAIGTVNKNTASGSTNPIYDWVGTLAEYESQNVATTHPDWVCYITDDIEGGESVYTKTEQDVMLAEKADVDLSNSTRLTNCILDIPQDVKITLSADKKTAYVEAGTVMYYADGFEQDGITKKFTKIILNSRRAIGIDPITTGTAPGYFPIVFRYNQNSGNGIFWANVPFDYCVSGSTNPGNKYEWYDTTNNIEGYTINGALYDRSTFPIGMLYRDEDDNLTIAQIYNGFGYIGSIVYAVPGIKYLMPDGLQTGGQLKTIENTTSVLSVVSNPDTTDATQVLLLDSSGLIQRANVWISSTTKPIFTENYTQLWFNPDTNLVYRYRDSSTQSYINACLVGRFTHNDSTKITDFSTRNAFIAADYNELDGFVEDKILELGYRPTLFAHEWDDKLRNDVQWLRGDTFSWQDGKVYKAAYKHLYDDWASGYTIKTDVVAGHTLSYRLAADGHKIVPAAYESIVAAIYEDTGIAWYYIIDTTNKRFKLPRDNSGVNRVLIKTLNLGAGWARIYSDGWVEQGGLIPANNYTGTVELPITMADTNYYLSVTVITNRTAASFDDELYPRELLTTGFALRNFSGGQGKGGRWEACGYGNTKYLKNISTQFTTEYKYLYFYVGKYTQSALLNTAGMKTETVNDKADRNLLNSVPTSQFAQLLLNAGIDTVVASQLPTEANGYKWYRKYASGWVEQGGCYDKGSATRDFAITIDLPITMLNNLYTATATCARNTGNATNRSGYTTIFTQSETQLGIGYYGVGTSDTMQYINWEVKGKAAN